MWNTGWKLNRQTYKNISHTIQSYNIHSYTHIVTLNDVYCGVFTTIHTYSNIRSTVHENVGVLKEVVRVSDYRETTSNSLSKKY